MKFNKILLDGDILPYEIGFGAEYNKDGIPSFEYVEACVDGFIERLMDELGVIEPPTIFLSGKGNFRVELAQRKGYKESRKDSVKPFHFYNIRAYLKSRYGAIEVEGIEADDALAMAQTADTILCSRDKDVRHVPGWHYSWECGKQASIGPYKVDLMGEFWTDKLPKELKGTGLRFFFAQCLMGDKVDSIPGLPGCGPVAAYEALRDLQTPEELEAKVVAMYEEKYAEKGREELTEQGQLLWMVRRYVDDAPEMWRIGYDYGRDRRDP